MTTNERTTREDGAEAARPFDPTPILLAKVAETREADLLEIVGLRAQLHQTQVRLKASREAAAEAKAEVASLKASLDRAVTERDKLRTAAEATEAGKTPVKAARAKPAPKAKGA